MMRLLKVMLAGGALLLIAVIALWWFSPSARYRLETPTREYANAREAQKLFQPANFVGSGFPGFQVPASASDIRLTYNIDTEAWWFSFRFEPQDSAGGAAAGRPLDRGAAAAIELTQPRWLRNWPRSVERLSLFRPLTQSSPGCMAVDWSEHRAYLWRCDTRAT